MKTLKEQCIERLETIVKNSCTYDYCKLEIVVTDWKNYGKDRTYFAIVEKSVNHKVSKHYVKKDYGYIDNIANEYVSGKKDLNRNITFGGSSF